ncbi:DUF3306 domain-containing protein [Pseudoduganella plicata]|uniref:DUF3306 domain-containing protein n=1 Tax=Pseudoduganella plicata TaxID=321984 RepID=A0A4P7BLM5_9BURK|nr:DUF3306 domain-containing protein [Pseudoduganella plicata]QBQ39157.1 DUF3306 domain-containing protein [Pseudoduganella plicata]GGY87805.1 hypothetical protein GCM10007388_21490 [Pseudoduganella plicata]
MAAETFFGRWSRRKAEAAQAEAPPLEAMPPAPAALPVPAEAAVPAPTLAQVAELQKDGDFRPFVARGVDEGVRRAAMKKLFTDPHFNVMDGLDIYIDDYSKSDPIPAAMLLAMNHAKDLLDPLGTIAREHAKRGLLTAADVRVQPEPAPEGEQAATIPEEHHEAPGQGVPESPIAPTEPVAPEPAAAPSLIDPADPADRQEDHEQPNQSL